MSTIVRTAILAAAVTLATSLLAWPASADEEVSAPPVRHCAAILHPLGTGPTPAPIVKCFRTVAESVAYGSGGAIRMAPGQKYPTEAQAEATARDSVASVLLGIEYGDDQFNGSDLMLYGSSGSGCYSGSSYGFPSLPSGWNDEISSAVSYNSCDGWHYEHTYYGSLRICNCRTMGVMNDETSSIVFK